MAITVRVRGLDRTRSDAALFGSGSGKAVDDFFEGFVMHNTRRIPSVGRLTY